MNPQKLNPHLPAASISARFENSSAVPITQESGDPLRGERLSYKWTSAAAEGIELHLLLGASCFVDSVVLTVGEKTALASVLLKTAGGAVLASHRAESGKSITAREIPLTASALTDSLVLVLTGNFSDIELDEIALYGVLGDAPAIFPTPSAASIGEKRIPASRFDTYLADSDDGARAGEILSEKLSEITGYPLKKSHKSAFVRFLTDPSVAANGYTLKICEDGAEIRASDLRGFVMGVETLVKLADTDGIPEASVSDEPFLPFRGVHLFLPSVAGMEFFRRLVKYQISPMGYNAIILEIATGMRYESHPEVTEAFLDAHEKAKKGIWPPFPHGSVAEGTVLSKSDIREVIAHIRSYGIEVIPEVQSLAHVPYLTLAHPEIAEEDPEEAVTRVDTRVEDAIPNKFYPHCYCPSKDRSYEILFDILDEVIEVFEPREYVHMGHDEVYYMGLCPRCKGRSHAELFASDVNRIYDHLKARGLKMMIWSDMLQPVTKYQTSPAVDLIPKDILCLDFIWYFHLGKDIEDNLLDKGFTVAVGNLYSSHFPRYESRIRKSGMVGGQISAWVATTEEKLQKEGKLYDFYMTAEMLWSEDYTRFCIPSYDRMIRNEMPRLRERLKGIRYPSRIAGASQALLFEDLPDLPPVYRADREKTVILDRPYDSLVITHTMLRRLSRGPWLECPVVGHYLLTYADGSTEEIPITAGGNIAHWNRRHNEPILHPLYRHNGYTATYSTDGEEYLTESGEPVTLYRYEHLLKRGVPPLTLALVEDPEVDARVLLCRVEGYVAPENN